MSLPTRPTRKGLSLEFLEHRSLPSVYTVTDLGTFGGTESHGYGINEAGQVAGFATTADELPLAFRWDRGQLTDLGTLGGLAAIGFGIDDRGRVVGTANNTDPDTVNGGEQGHAFLWDRGSLRDLGTVPGTINSDAWAINSRGQVVGWSYNLPPDFVNPVTTPHNSHAFVWDGGVMTDLALPDGMKNSFAGAVNDSGVIAGNAADGSTLHALVWRKYRTGTYVPLDLGFPAGTFRSSLRGINNDGDVVGDARLTGGPGHAFWWNPDGHGGYLPTDLGTLGGFGSGALDINNRDQIVGRSRAADGQQHAFLYDAAGMHDLNGLIPADSGWVLDTARSINDRGQVVGVGIHDGEFHGFLLTPTHGYTASATPGPQRVVVYAGKSIQAAVDAALSGTAIYIQPGVYAESVHVAKPDTRLIGPTGPRGERVFVTNPGDEEDGVTATADNFELRNVTIRGFEENGVLLTGVETPISSYILPPAGRSQHRPSS
jgi:probable HAF family extracellular repeat protein